MSYCLNPDANDCQKPENPDNTIFCQSCGSKLRLKDRYRAIKVLGRGSFGKTFLAVDEYTGARCVIKQLLPKDPQLQGHPKVIEHFEREAKQLAELGTHPQIPTWFDNFEQGLEKAGQQANKSTQKYLYIVIEYIEGENLLKELLQRGKFNEQKIREFLKDILPVLKFIHDKNVIHRDIKPENIMRRNSDGKMVLIDFGGVKEFTQTNLGNTGTQLYTPGYAPKEQAQYQKVYPASDLYCLAASCIHLLTKIPPHNLYDPQQDCWIWRQHLAKPISPHLGQILDKLLKESVRERYQSADEVIKEFIPEVKLSQSSLIFTATKINEILTQTIKITNSIPDTLLEGRWEVAPHPNDPPHTPNSHAWISFAPAQFASNQIDCKITVNTSNLQADQAGERQILLHTNSSPDTYILTVKIQTAPLPIETRKLPYLYLCILFIASSALAWIESWFVVAFRVNLLDLWALLLYYLGFAGFLAMIGALLGAEIEDTIDSKLVGAVGLVVVMSGVFAVIVFGAGATPGSMAVAMIAVFAIVAAVAVYLIMAYYTILQKISNFGILIVLFVLLTTGLGISLGIGFTVGFLNPSIILALAGTGLPLATMIFYPLLRRRKLIAKYQQSQQHLIKP